VSEETKDKEFSSNREESLRLLLDLRIWRFIVWCCPQFFYNGMTMFLPVAVLTGLATAKIICQAMPK
jgi:hypothetical protein